MLALYPALNLNSLILPSSFERSIPAKICSRFRCCAMICHFLLPCLAWRDAHFRLRLRSAFTLFVFSAFLLLHGAASSAPGSLFRLQHKYRGRDGSFGRNVGKPVSLEHLQALRSRDRLRHSRVLLSAESYPLGGIADPNIAGLYFTEVQLGTPPSKYYVQVDTGSDLLWLNCESCKTCPQSTDLGVRLTLYNPQSSSTSNVLTCGDTYCSAPSSADCQRGQPCSYQRQYGDGSSSEGYYVRDSFQLDIVAGNHSVKTANASVAFGCGTSQGGELQQPDQALDGIMGFGQSNLSVLSQLVNQKQAPGVFAHCLEGEGEGGGILLIGHVQEPGLVYTSMISNQPHYNVDLQSISVSGVTIPIDSSVSSSSDSKGTIIDSGTTLAYFSDSVYQRLLKAILSALPQDTQVYSWQEMNCVAYSGSVDDGFPSVTLNFDGKGAIMVVKPHEYLIAAEGNSAVGWCIGFQNPGQSDLALNILGDLILKDRLVVYDLEQQRIGWVDYNCSSNVTVLSPTGQVDYVGASSIASISDISSAAIVNGRVVHSILWLLVFYIHNL